MNKVFAGASRGGWSRLCEVQRLLSVRNSAKVELRATFAMQPSIFEVKDTSAKEQRTFWRDDSLPSLPVPSLSDAVTKYLDSCKSVLNDEEYTTTKGIVDKFVSTEGPKLHNQLEEKSKRDKNWLDEWWLDGYLTYRGPSGYLNFTACCKLEPWPLQDQLESCALVMHLTMKFWSMLHEERLRQQSDAKGNPFTMYQFRYLYNTCRIPLPVKDDLLCWFKSKYEGDCPSHIIVIHNKKMYKVQGVCKETGEVYTPRQFHKILVEISKDKTEGTNLTLLSELDRDTWSEARAHLLGISPKNQTTLREVETAAFCCSIGDNSVSDDPDDFMKYGMLGTYGYRWMDKLNMIITKNSKCVLHSDHTPLDGMVIVTMLSYMKAVLLSMKTTGLEQNSHEDSLCHERAEELIFEVDDKILSWIQEGNNVGGMIRNQADVSLLTIEGMGRIDLKKLGRVHPCAFVQICLQLAYMRQHGKPAPTYETATTRIFYRGRTETLRTCTPETVAFCNAFINNKPNQKALFIAACEKYSSLMEDCKVANGCDRHLLGLAMIANQNGLELPEIFKDPAFVKSGGNGNFILSTSLVGYSTPAVGGVLPMTKDGYGSFYLIHPDSLQFCNMSYKNSSETDLKSFSRHLEQALLDVYGYIAKDRHRL